MEEHEVRGAGAGHASSEEAGTGSAGRDQEAGLSRKDRERAMHRDQILDAARNLLGRKAYSEITVQEIAADAEFSVGYIYKIFESKEDIYVTLVSDQWDQLIRILEREAFGDRPFGERLDAVVCGIFGWLDANPAFTASHTHEIHCLAHALPRLAQVHAEAEERLHERSVAFMTAGVEAGSVSGDVEVMTKTLRALIWGFVGEEMLHGVKAQKWTEYTPVVVGVFLRAFAPEGGSR